MARPHKSRKQTKDEIAFSNHVGMKLKQFRTLKGMSQ